MSRNFRIIKEKILLLYIKISGAQILYIVMPNILNCSIDVNFVIAQRHAGFFKNPHICMELRPGKMYIIVIF